MLVLTVIPMLSFNYPETADRKTAAVCTFFVSKYIDFSELNGNAALAGSIATLADDPKFDLTSVLNNFHDKFFNTYAKAFPFDLMAESEVINNEQYKAYESKFGESGDADLSKIRQRYLCVEGYKPLQNFGLSKDNKNSTQMLKIFDSADGVMFVYLNYSFVPKLAVGGTGSAGIRATINFRLWNKEGKKVFDMSESAVSKKTVALVGGIPAMKLDKLLPMCENASAELMEDLEKRLPKIAKKVEKKF